MSDLHHWRHVQFHNRVEWAHPDSHKSSVQAFDESPQWERVHIFNEAELAAHDREVKAEALREAAVAMRAHKDPGHWNLRDERDPANASQSPDAWLEVRADRIESQETP